MDSDGKNIDHYRNFLYNVKYDLKQNIINCGLVPSLTYITLVRISVKLWQAVIESKVRSCSFTIWPIEKFVKIVEKKVLKNASSFILPPNCKDDLERMIRSLGRRLLIFLNCQEPLLRNRKDKYIYFKNICWNQQGTINSLKTAINLIDHSNLSINEKFIIACNNCLKEKIISLRSNVPKKFILNLRKKAYGYPNFNMPHCLVLFWAYNISGNLYRFSELTNGVPIYEFVLNFAHFSKKDAAVQYIWMNFADDIIKEKTVNYFKNSKEPCSHKMLFLFQQNGDEQIENQLQMQMRHSLIDILKFVSSWCGANYLTQYLTDVIKTQKVLDAFEIISYCFKMKYLYWKQYENIWAEFAIQFKSDVELKFKSICKKYLFKNDAIHVNESDFFNIISLLKIGTNKSKRKMLHSDDGVTLCIKFLSSQKFNKFVSEMLSSKEEISKFISTFFDRNSIKICLAFTDFMTYNKLQNILIKYCSQKEIIKFKNELPFKNQACIIIHMHWHSPSKNKDLLTSLEKLLNWCFDRDEEKILECKAVIFYLESEMYRQTIRIFLNFIRILIIQENWELVKHYWKWIFYATKEKVTSPKEKLVRIKKILINSSTTEMCDQLKQFITSCFEQKEIDELREELKCSDVLLSAVEDILKQDKLQEGDELLSWCFAAFQEEIDAFKNKFVNLIGTKLVIQVISNGGNMHKLDLLVEWFKPAVLQILIPTDHLQIFNPLADLSIYL